ADAGGEDDPQAALRRVAGRRAHPSRHRRDPRPFARARSSDRVASGGQVQAERAPRQREALLSDPTVMGRLDAVEVRSKKLTVQTEFFLRPSWRIETKVYLGGALKKVYTEDLAGTPEAELQRTVDTFHKAKMDEIVDGLRRLSQ